MNAMKTLKKYFAIGVLVGFAIILVTYLGYTYVYVPVSDAYTKYGLNGALVAVGVIVIQTILLTGLTKLIFWSVDQLE